jgi:hypothetical protein
MLFDYSDTYEADGFVMLMSIAVMAIFQSSSEGDEVFLTSAQAVSDSTPLFATSADNPSFKIIWN